VTEQRLCEGSGLGNVDIDSGIEGVGWAHVSLLIFLENSVTAVVEFEDAKIKVGTVWVMAWGF
jgi:hypothetical protein